MHVDARFWIWTSIRNLQPCVVMGGPAWSCKMFQNVKFFSFFFNLCTIIHGKVRLCIHMHIRAWNFDSLDAWWGMIVHSYMTFQDIILRVSSHLSWTAKKFCQTFLSAEKLLVCLTDEASISLELIPNSVRKNSKFLI